MSTRTLQTRGFPCCTCSPKWQERISLSDITALHFKLHQMVKENIQLTYKITALQFQQTITLLLHFIGKRMKWDKAFFLAEYIYFISNKECF